MCKYLPQQTLRFAPWQYSDKSDLHDVFLSQTCHCLIFVLNLHYLKLTINSSKMQSISLTHQFISDS